MPVINNNKTFCQSLLKIKYKPIIASIMPHTIKTDGFQNGVMAIRKRGMSIVRHGNKNLLGAEETPPSSPSAPPPPLSRGGEHDSVPKLFPIKISYMRRKNKISMANDSAKCR